MINKKIKPSKIVCVGLNYRQHAAELKMTVPVEPIIFLKPPTSLIYDQENIIYPNSTNNLHYEAELGIVIKKTCQQIKPEQSAEYILGYVCANDVTARDLQNKDQQWTRAKSFDTFCPVSTTIVDNINPDDLQIQAKLNGKVVQNSRTSDMIFDIPTIVSFISQIMTLQPEDLILTGTPQGVGPMQKGDEITIEIENVGKLTNFVR